MAPISCNWNQTKHYNYYSNLFICFWWEQANAARPRVQRNSGRVPPTQPQEDPQSNKASGFPNRFQTAASDQTLFGLKVFYLAGLNAPPDTVPPINTRAPIIKPMAKGANPAFVLPEVVFFRLLLRRLSFRFRLILCRPLTPAQLLCPLYQTLLRIRRR